MTRTIESLKTSPFHEDKLYDRIADTYFHQKNRHKSKKRKNSLATRNLHIAFVAVSIAAAAIFLAVTAYSFIYDQYVNMVKKKVANSTMLAISDGGMVNREILKNLELRGYAKGHGKFSKENMVLTSPKKYNWADLALNFKFPIDFSNTKLSLSLKGDIGGEKVGLVLRDVNNRALRLSDIYLASDWKTKTISLNGAGSNIDLSRITHFRLEYGQIGESATQMDSPIDVTIYVKDIKIIKEI